MSAVHDAVNIVADIGGTNARFAYVSPGGDRLQGIEYLACADFPDFGDALRAYRDTFGLRRINKICLAVAGPIVSERVHLTNNQWQLSRPELERTLAVPVVLINDFTAQALSIDKLSESELGWLGAPRPGVSAGVRVIVGPGTGLGVAALLPSGEVIASEGGHIAFAPLDEREFALLQLLWQRYSRVSVERVLSGMGLANLYWANSRLRGVDRELSAPQITEGALAGDALCVQTVDDFFAALAAFVGDVALMMGASGGVYISGGIVPRLKTFLNAEQFRARFADKGRFQNLCENIPIALVLAEHPGLTGCVAALERTDCERA